MSSGREESLQHARHSAKKIPVENVFYLFDLFTQIYGFKTVLTLWMLFS